MPHADGLCYAYPESGDGSLDWSNNFLCFPIRMNAMPYCEDVNVCCPNIAYNLHGVQKFIAGTVD